MKPGPRFTRLRRIATVAIGIALVAIAWNYSASDPAFRDPKSPWIPLAFSPDGKILAAADLTGAKQWWEGPIAGPGGPIHLLRADGLAPAGPPVETPTIVTERGAFHPVLQSVVFSPNGDLLAVLQKHHEIRGPDKDMFELLLIRLPGREIVKSFSIPYDGFHARDRAPFVGQHNFDPTNIARECNGTWGSARSTECASGHGTLVCGAPRGFGLRRSISDTTSYLRIPDISGLPARHEIQHSAAATTSSPATTHSLEWRCASMLPSSSEVLSSIF
jgi:hypothetical protein